MFKLPSDPIAVPCHKFHSDIVRRIAFIHCIPLSSSLSWTLSNEASTPSKVLFTVLYNKADVQQLVQKSNDGLIQHGLRLKLNKIEFLTTDPLLLIGTITVIGNDLPRFKYHGSML